MERVDRNGGGMIRARSRSIGLLYYRNYARRPSEVRRLAPELITDYRNRWRELREPLRQGDARAYGLAIFCAWLLGTVGAEVGGRDRASTT